MSVLSIGLSTQIITRSKKFQYSSLVGYSLVSVRFELDMLLAKGNTKRKKAPEVEYMHFHELEVLAGTVVLADLFIEAPRSPNRVGEMLTVAAIQHA